jgi:peroxiredoxin Q/BCP
MAKAMPKPGEMAPVFCLPDQDGNEVCLAGFRGQWVVLYFYPKDNTPGCTKEACAFTERLADFKGMDAVVLGVSRDSPESHRKFAARHGLEFPLLSDPDHMVIEHYGAWQPKKMMGREFLGIVRSTFLIDPQGRVAAAWPKVQVWGHADEVKQKLAELRG